MSDGPGDRPTGVSRRRRARAESPAQRRERHGAESDPEVVLAAAVRFLEARPRSVAEVRRRLRGSGYPPPLIDAAVARLEELGFLDDETFARSWVESRDRARPRGERALRSELLGKGIDRTVVDLVLAERRGEGEPRTDGAEAPVDVDETAARWLIARHARSLGRVTDPRVRRQRAYALLARNGFDPDVAGRVAHDLDGSAEALDAGDEGGPDAPPDAV
jgi:regulatory protein